MNAEYWRTLFIYEPESGSLRWRVCKGPRAKAGAVAGAMNVAGYFHVQVDGKKLKAHRIAWAMHTGHEPAGKIDHIDGDKSNNRFANLRVVTNAVNCQNVRDARKNNKVGLLGVYKKKGRFIASIWTKATKTKHLGCYATAEAAHLAYVAAKRELHEGCTI